MKIIIPDNWNEVTVGQFQEMAELPEDDYRANSIISILTDTDPAEVEKITTDDRLKILLALKWVFATPDEKTYKRHIVIEGVDYYLQDYRELKIGERIDLKEYCKNSTTNLHKIFAILYKPETPTRYTQELFRDKVMIGDVYGSLVFFYHIAKRSTMIIQSSLMDEMSQTLTKQKKKKESV